MESTIKQEVEKKLQDKQKSKEFKDVGRVSNTRKELAAYRLVNIENLNDLEQDKVIAFNLVKKENVWKPIDVASEKEKGTSPGAAYLKVEIRKSLPAKPKDGEGFRKAYVLGLTTLQNDLEPCRNMEDILNLCNKYRSFNVYDFTINFVEALPEGMSKEAFEETAKKRLGYFRVSKALTESLGVRFYNLISRSSDAAIQTWKDARELDPVSELIASLIIENLNKRKEKSIESINAQIKSYIEADIPTLKQILLKEFNKDGWINKTFKSLPEDSRRLAINYRENQLKTLIEAYDKQISEAKAKDGDWSWALKEESTIEDGEKVKKVKGKSINTKTPLSYIKRTGGFAITDISVQSIVNNFGFTSVNYGNYVDDKWSKDHTKHFLGAMSDFGEILNIDIKKLTQIGGLNIAFGAKGRPGHLATYFPQTKDINLTRGNGDGSLAHEYGHYIDNVLMEGKAKSTTSLFISDYKRSDNPVLNRLFKELVDFMIKGEQGITPLLPVRFYPQKQKDVPTVYYRSYSAVIELKGTIEETLEQEEVKKICVLDSEYHSTQNRILGYIIDAFGLDYYDVPLRLKVSYFYHKSAYNVFNYNTLIDGKYKITGDNRTKYWTSTVELFARAFETVILKKFLDKNRVSNYLVADIETKDIVSEHYFSPYPTGAELQKIEGIIDEIILNIKQHYSIGDFVPPSELREDEYIDLSQSGLNEAGMVVEDKKESKQITFVEEDKTVKVVNTSKEDKSLFIQKRLKALNISARFSKDEKEGESYNVYRGVGERINETYGGISDDGIGTFYTDNPTMAKWFAGLIDYDVDSGKYKPTNKIGKVEESIINLKKPYIVDETRADYDIDNEDDSFQIYMREIKAKGGVENYKADLQKQGYDGIILKGNATNYYEDGTYSIYIIFDKKSTKENIDKRIKALELTLRMIGKKFRTGGDIPVGFDMEMEAKAIQLRTGMPIDLGSLRKEGYKYVFKYKGQSKESDLSVKLVQDTISINRKSLEERNLFGEGGGVDAESKFTFLSNSPMQRARALNVLEKGLNVDGKYFGTTYQWIESLPAGLETGTTEVSSRKTESGVATKLAIGDWIVNYKAEQDYYKYLQNGGYPYSKFVKEEEEKSKIEKEKQDAQRKIDEEISLKKQIEQEKESKKLMYLTYKIALQQGEKVYLNKRLNYYFSVINDLKSRRQTQSVIDEINYYNKQIEEQSPFIKKEYLEIIRLYKIVGDDVVPKYDWKKGDKVLVEERLKVNNEWKDVIIETSIEEIKEDEYGNISYKVEKVGGISNPNLSYMSILPTPEAEKKANSSNETPKEALKKEIVPDAATIKGFSESKAKSEFMSLTENSNYRSSGYIYDDGEKKEGVIQLMWGKYGYSVDESQQSPDYNMLYTASLEFNKKFFGEMYAIAETSDKFNDVTIACYEFYAKSDYFLDILNNRNKKVFEKISSMFPEEKAVIKLKQENDKENLKKEQENKKINEISSACGFTPTAYLIDFVERLKGKGFSNYGFKVAFAKARIGDISSYNKQFNDIDSLFKYLKEGMVKLFEYRSNETSIEFTVYLDKDYFNFKYQNYSWSQRSMVLGNGYIFVEQDKNDKKDRSDWAVETYLKMINDFNCIYDYVVLGKRKEEQVKPKQKSNETPKEALKTSNDSNKLDLIEKRLKALKISLRFSKDKVMVEKRIKALGISLKSLRKSEFSINPLDGYDIIYGKVGTQLGNKFKLGIIKENTIYLFDLYGKTIPSGSKKFTNVTIGDFANFSKFTKRDYKNIETIVNSKQKGVWQERSSDIKYVAENPDKIILKIEELIKKTKDSNLKYEESKKNKLKVKKGDVLVSITDKTDSTKVSLIQSNGEVYGINKYGSEIYLGINGEIVGYDLQNN